MSSNPDKLTSVAAALHMHFPQLGAIKPLHELGEGFRSLAVETADGIVFRIAKNQAAAVGYAKEVCLLPMLHQYIHIPLPDPQWYAAPSEHFPFGLIGYCKLSGKVLLPEMLLRADSMQLATDVAKFLLALQQIPTQELLSLLPVAEIMALEVQRNELLPALRGSLSNTEYQTVALWWERLLADPQMQDYAPVVQHRDLWYENMLVDAQTCSLVGVIDWEQAALGDPAQDFATQLHLGEHFTAQVIAAYRIAGGALNGSFYHRLQRHWELREFDGLHFAVQSADHVEFKEGIQKLRRGPLFNPQKCI
jgi:aminoglycoside phosphotransferase (APT) family kinase protein